MIIRNLCMGNGDEYDQVTYAGDEQVLMEKIGKGEFLTLTLIKGKEILINPAYIVSFEMDSEGLRVI